MQFQTFPLTQTQTHALPRLTAAGNRCAVYQLEGPLDEARLERAIQTTLRRCPPLSYKCLKLDGGLQIMQSQDEESPLQIIDVASDDALYTLIENYRRRTFRLDGGAPYLFCLLRGKRFNHLLFVCHPWLLDRFSLKPFFSALSAAYRGPVEESSLGLSQETLLEDEKARLASHQRSEGLRFWLQLLRDSSFEWRPARSETQLAENYFSVRYRWKLRRR